MSDEAGGPAPGQSIAEWFRDSKASLEAKLDAEFRAGIEDFETTGTVAQNLAEAVRHRAREYDDVATAMFAVADALAAGKPVRARTILRVLRVSPGRAQATAVRSCLASDLGAGADGEAVVE